MTKRVLRIDELAECLNTTVNAIRSNLQRRNFLAIPRPMRLGGRVVWSVKQVEEFLALKEQEALGNARPSGSRNGRGRNV